jgi:hypothetical protein
VKAIGPMNLSELGRKKQFSLPEMFLHPFLESAEIVMSL